jgi:hypothetical protein
MSMVTLASVSSAAGKFAIGIATNYIRDFFKRRKLKAAYAKAAVTVFTYYETTGIHFEHPSWLGISRLVRAEECGAALSMGGALTDDVLDRLRRIYSQTDPPMEDILGRLVSEIRIHARKTLPLDFQTLEDILSAKVALLRVDVKGVGEQIKHESVRADERQVEVLSRIDKVNDTSDTSSLFVGVPSLSTSEIFGRNKLLKSMTERLISGDSIALSAQGLPGVGKTTLAMALANSDEILKHFSDGILWVGLGPVADVARHLTTWAGSLNIDVTGIPSKEDRSQAVKDAVGQRRMLLVIDDAWEIDAANLMMCGGPNCVHLLTTRNQEIARDFAGPQGTQVVPVLDDPDAFDMLKSLAPEACDANPKAAQELAEAVGGLPLALELLGRYLAAPEHSYFPDLSVKAFAEMADPKRRLELAQRRLGEP